MTALKKGFTLIELLIVMAILGVLAVVVLVAINPAEQLRRARDSGRISGVQQVGRAITAYYTANGVLPGSGNPPATIDFTQDLLDSQELQSIPTGICEAGGCAVTCTGGQPAFDTWCYKFTSVGTGEVFVLYADLFSVQRLNQCGAGATNVFSIFSSSAGRGGLFCGAEPVATSVPTI